MMLEMDTADLIRQLQPDFDKVAVLVPPSVLLKSIFSDVLFYFASHHCIILLILFAKKLTSIG